MKLIFRTDIFIEDIISKGILDTPTQVLDAHGTWLVDCEGREVIHGLIDNYAIREEWCEKIEE